jgi:perosamine synthetase
VTWNLDVAELKGRVGPRTRAIIAVHTYGHPADMDPILEFARAHDLLVVEDAAEAHGAEYRGRAAGSLGDIASFSFYANKVITTGEGGMVTTRRSDLDRAVRNLRDLAFSGDRHFWHEHRGFNYRMSNLQAAVGLAQTERFADLVRRRRRNARLYAERLSAIDGLTLPQESPGAKSVFWMYGLLVEEDFGPARDELRSHLAERGVETRSFFVPLHLQPICAPAFQEEHFPVSEALCGKGLYLPSGPLLSEEEIDYIAETIASAR